MVRLRVRSSEICQALGLSFQFQYGAIKRDFQNILHFENEHFNSSMVRLRVQVDERLLFKAKFQFQYGGARSLRLRAFVEAN